MALEDIKLQKKRREAWKEEKRQRKEDEARAKKAEDKYAEATKEVRRDKKGKLINKKKKENSIIEDDVQWIVKSEETVDLILKKMKIVNDVFFY